MLFVQTSNFGETGAIKATVKKGTYTLREHMHQFSEIIVVLDGEIDITVNGKIERAKAGDIAVIQPFLLHSFATPEYCHIWLTVFSNDFISDFSESDDLVLYGERAVFTPAPEVLSFLKSRMIDTLEGLLFCDNTQYRHMKAALYAAYENYVSTVPVSSKSLNSVKTEVLSSVISYIREHYAESISLVSVARALGYNPEYVSHCLSALEGMNFRGLVNSFRIDKAKSLLLTTKRTIVDIALECGFTCERSFHRIFLQMTGITPGEYKKNRNTAERCGYRSVKL